MEEEVEEEGDEVSEYGENSFEDETEETRTVDADKEDPFAEDDEPVEEEFEEIE